MTDVYGGPFGAYTNVAGVIGATAAGQVASLKAPLLALFDPASGSSAAHPDFNKVSPAFRKAIEVEINAVFAAIAAAPTS